MDNSQSSIVAPPVSTRTTSSSTTLADFTDQINALLCCLLFATQTSFFTYFLISLFQNYLWLLWILYDVALLAFLIFAIVIVYLRRRRPTLLDDYNNMLHYEQQSHFTSSTNPGSTTTISEQLDNGPADDHYPSNNSLSPIITTVNGQRRQIITLDRYLPSDFPGDLPYAYGVWLFYSIGLCVRVLVLLIYIKQNPDLVSFQTESADSHFGPTSFYLVVGISLPFFYYLVNSVSLRRNLPTTTSMIDENKWQVYMELLHLLDAIDLLSVFFQFTRSDTASVIVSIVETPVLPGNSQATIGYSVMAFFVVGFVLSPTIRLAQFVNSRLSDNLTHDRTVNTQTTSARSLAIFHIIISLFFVNLPFVILRALCWRLAGLVVSAFFLKNLLFLFINLRQLIVWISTPFGIYLETPLSQNSEKQYIQST